MPCGNMSPELWVLLTVGVPQLSVAVGAVQFAVAQLPAGAVSTILAGQAVSIGGVTSVDRLLPLIVKVYVPSSLSSLLTVTVAVCVPTAVG